MPISITCQCGKSLSVRDDLAGKAVKCPSCGQVIRVSGGPAAAAPRPPQPPAPAPMPPAGGLDDLFDEEGFSDQVAAVCPACRVELPAGAVLCTKCGYHMQSGHRFEAHKTAGVDIDHGTLALEKAERDLADDDAMQRKMIRGAGLPWWALAMILFALVSALTIAVLVVNASRRTEESIAFNPVGLFFVMIGSAFYLVSLGANLMIIGHAFQKDTVKGVLCLFLPLYILFYVITNWRETWKFFVVAVFGGFTGGLLLGLGAAFGGM